MELLEGRSAFKILTGKRPLGRPRRRWQDNIRMDLEEIGINAGNSYSQGKNNKIHFIKEDILL